MLHAFLAACRAFIRTSQGVVLGIILFPCRRNQLIPHPSKGKSRGLRHMDNWSQHHAGHQSDHTPYSSCYASALVLSIHNLGNTSHSSTRSLIRGNATDHFKLGWNEAGTCLNPLHRQLPGCNTLEFNLLIHGFRVPIMQNSEVSIMYLHVEILPIVYGAYIGEGRRGEGKGGEGQRREERGGEGRGGAEKGGEGRGGEGRRQGRQCWCAGWQCAGGGST